MVEIINFIPQAGMDARANVRGFVETWQGNVAALGDVVWQDDIWDVTEHIIRTGRAQARTRIHFTSFCAKRLDLNAPLSQPFADFAKAYFVYLYAMRSSVHPNAPLTALRVLEKALVQVHGRSDVEAVNGAVCNLAITFLQDNYTQAGAYGAGRCLASLVRLLSDGQMVMVPFQWRNPLKIGRRLHHVGPEADERRKRKMPSVAALDALPKCFAISTETRDVVATSIAALLCTAPDRISEVFSLPVECEVEREHKGKTIYGLRWWPRKGAEPTVKWIAPTMVEVAKAAVAKLKTACAPAREVAAWYRANPEKMFLPPYLEHLRGSKELTFTDVAAMLGMRTREGASVWCKTNGVQEYSRPNHIYRKFVHFGDVEAAVLAMLPRNFPIIDLHTGLCYDDALIVLRLHETKPQLPTFLPMITPIGSDTINRALGGRPTASVFARFGFTEPDGSPIVVTTHQFRHWLNTLAQQGGLSQLDIAKWSGRKDVRQNEDYDHMTGDELIAMARQMTNDDKLFGSIATLISKSPVSRDEFLMLEFPTAHVTELGFCVHDFSMLPCQRHRDCMNCNEHVCVKGDNKKTLNIRRQLEIAEEQMHRAEAAKADGYYGAERWYQHHVASVRRLRELVAILDDIDVPIGSLIRLTARNEFSPIARAAEERSGLEKADWVTSSHPLLGSI